MKEHLQIADYDKIEKCVNVMKEAYDKTQENTSMLLRASSSWIKAREDTEENWQLTSLAYFAVVNALNTKYDQRGESDYSYSEKHLMTK